VFVSENQPTARSNRGDTQIEQQAVQHATMGAIATAGTLGGQQTGCVQDVGEVVSPQGI
jgi:hypothetical protein